MSNPLESWSEEQRSAFLYRACAEAESGTARAELFMRLAGEAEAQAAIWRAQLTARGTAPPAPFVPDARTQLVARLVSCSARGGCEGVLAAMKVRGMSIYGTSLGVRARPRPAHRRRGVERRHRGLGGGGNLRAAVFGVNDGLVSNASLILGVAGASADPQSCWSPAWRASPRARSRWPPASTCRCARSASSSSTRSASSATSSSSIPMPRRRSSR